MLIRQPLTRSPISAVPQNEKTMIALTSAGRLSPIALEKPKKTMKRSTICGMILTISRYTLDMAVITGFFSDMSVPRIMPRKMLIPTDIRLILSATNSPCKSLIKFVPLNKTSKPIFYPYHQLFPNILNLAFFSMTEPAIDTGSSMIT